MGKRCGAGANKEPEQTRQTSGQGRLSGRRRAFQNDKRVNSPGTYNNPIHVSTKQHGAKLCEAKTDRTAGGGGEPAVGVGDPDMPLSGAGRSSSRSARTWWNSAARQSAAAAAEHSLRHPATGRVHTFSGSPKALTETGHVPATKHTTTHSKQQKPSTTQ